mmetsp:Transcript_51538/g.134640  ORF Transcript_51538/g.134640 Transcript_51538/m.134640 type:complete len:203 (-) Transcript_51538:459-1067(-)
MPHPAHRGVVLDEAKAAAIFQMRPFYTSRERFAGQRRVVAISKMFGVAPKTIRDIWNEETWTRVTSKLQPKSTGIEPQFQQHPTSYHISFTSTLRPQDMDPAHISPRNLVDVVRTSTFESGSAMHSQSMEIPTSGSGNRSFFNHGVCDVRISSNFCSMPSFVEGPNLTSQTEDIDWILGQWDKGLLEIQRIPDPFSADCFLS